MHKLSLAALLLVTACAAVKQEPTPYGASKEGGFGYVDRQTVDKHYEIQVRGNEATSAYTLERYFHRRAAELCGNENFDSFIKHEKETSIQDGQLTRYYYRPTTTSALPMVTGEIVCK